MAHNCLFFLHLLPSWPEALAGVFQAGWVHPAPCHSPARIQPPPGLPRAGVPACPRSPFLPLPCAGDFFFLLQGLTSPCCDTPTHSCAQPWVGKAWQQPSGSSKDRARTSRKGAPGQEHAAGRGPRGSNPCCCALWCPSLCEPQPQNTAGARGDEAPSVYFSPQQRAAPCSPLFPLW